MKTKYLAVILLLAGIASAAETVIGYQRFKAFDPDTGAMLVGGKLQSYVCGTTTPTSTFSDSIGTANTNPVILDGSGEGNIWLDPNVCYKLVLKDASDAVIWTLDNVYAPQTGPFTALISGTTNPAATGVIRLAKSDCIVFRNNANSGDVNAVCLNGSDQVIVGSGPFVIPAISDTAVGKATTDTLTNKTISAATYTGTQTGGTWVSGTYNGSGANNSVTLLNPQGPIAAITGTAADATMFTYTLGANTWAANKCLLIDVGWSHSTGTAAATYKLKFDSTTISTIGAVADTSVGSVAIYKFCNIAQNSQYYELLVQLGAATNTVTPQFGTAAIDFANSHTISFTMSVANTDQVTPKFWKVSLDQ